MQQFINCINNNGITLNDAISNIKNVEYSIMANVQSLDKRRKLLIMASEFRYFLSYSFEQLNNNSNKKSVMWPSSSDEFLDCCRSSLSEIFDGGNPIEQAGYIIGMPSSWLWTAGACLW